MVKEESLILLAVKKLIQHCQHPILGIGRGDGIGNRLELRMRIVHGNGGSGGLEEFEIVEEVPQKPRCGIGGYPAATPWFLAPRPYLPRPP